MEKGQRERKDIGEGVGEKKEELFGPHEDAGRIYRAVCGQEIQRGGGGKGNVESLQARCSAEIFRLLKWREMSLCTSH